MKTIFFSFLILILASSCSRPEKDLAAVQVGMTKAEVINMVGEPEKKSVINRTEVWVYPDSNRAVVFRADTVHSIMTSARARLDSVSIWMDSTDNKIERGFEKVGDKLENAVDKIDDKAHE